MVDVLAENTEEKTQNVYGVSECLVDCGRLMHEIGLIGHADSLDDISEDLVRQMLQKVTVCEAGFSRDGYNEEKPGYAQGGFIRRQAIQSTPGMTIQRYSVYPITAKHNLRQLVIKNTPHYLASAKLAVANFCKAKLDGMPDFNWLPTGKDSISLYPPEDEGRAADCIWGFDVSVGGLMDSPDVEFTKPFCSFTLVRSALELVKGQKVGIVVRFNEETKPNKKTIAGKSEEEVDLDELTIKAIYGVPNKVNIYTGKITRVGENHIEYDINTFSGCSGAVVFLLDQNQPTAAQLGPALMDRVTAAGKSPLVQNCDFGSAIAVHSGSHPGKNRNFGFMIRKHAGFADVP